MWRTKLGKINRTITTTELNALCDGDAVPLDEREPNEGVLITQGAVEDRPGRGRLYTAASSPEWARIPTAPGMRPSGSEEAAKFKNAM